MLRLKMKNLKLQKMLKNKKELYTPFYFFKFSKNSIKVEKGNTIKYNI